MERFRVASNGVPASGVVSEVTVPADVSYAFIVRSVAVAVALRANFDLDEVDDLKLAADEMCASLMARAAGGEALVCRFSFEPGSILVVASVGTLDISPIATDTLGWQVLARLTDRAESWTTPGQRTPYEVHIGLRRSRPG